MKKDFKSYKPQPITCFTIQNRVVIQSNQKWTWVPQTSPNILQFCQRKELQTTGINACINMDSMSTWLLLRTYPAITVSVLSNRTVKTTTCRYIRTYCESHIRSVSVPPLSNVQYKHLIYCRLWTGSFEMSRPCQGPVLALLH